MLSGISIWQLLILLAIVVLIFGSKRLRNIGPDLGSALRGFRSAMKDDDDDSGKHEQNAESRVVSHEQESKDDKRPKTEANQHYDADRND